MIEKIVFVCTENTIVSPMAEAIFYNLGKETGINAISRGTVVLFSEPVNPKAATIINNHNLSFDHPNSIQLKMRDIENVENQSTTLTLTMTAALKKQVLEMFPEASNVFTIKEYCGEAGDVQDPYGGTLVDFEECYTELVRLVKKAIYKLEEARTHTNINEEGTTS